MNFRVVVFSYKMAMLCNRGKLALVALLFRPIPGSGKVFNYFKIKLMDLHKQFFLVFEQNVKLEVCSHLAEIMLQWNKKILSVTFISNCF